MRAMFSIVGLLIVVAIVGLLAKKQLTAGVVPRGDGASAASAPATPQQQVQQYKQSIEGAMQQSTRPMPDDVK